MKLPEGREFISKLRLHRWRKSFVTVRTRLPGYRKHVGWALVRLKVRRRFHSKSPRPKASSWLPIPSYTLSLMKAQVPGP